ncbi:cytochrome c-type biogenesis protein CcmH [Rhodobacteraceae bacterium RKSG542]|uniref:cytochrome c-type biogenesis protein n=1 Tax=Pseudovibrio flavus TaxID=2529854 RepID=UPI0012BD208C|nr:cytochrome c-type biogenesis protein [Pseudovibrio flavus]MTI17042.1 cytochrome c-type biogenesis protein CcmH [Pseudovibrio flavus]
MKKLISALALMVMFAASGPALAVNPDEVLKDPKLEQRARDLSLEIRCVVCQNQSIDDSNADLAKDLRLLVRERLQAGDSDKQVLDYLVDRYGEFVLLKPRIASHTLLLWIGGPLVLLIGGFVIFRNIRKQRSLGPDKEKSGPIPLSDAEKKELEELLKDE